MKDDPIRKKEYQLRLMRSLNEIAQTIIQESFPEHMCAPSVNISLPEKPKSIWEKNTEL